MRTWAALVLIILMCVPPLVVMLGRPRPQQFMEGLALMSAQETWQRQHAGESDAWLTPTQNGEIRVRKPPMLVWLDILAWTGLDPANAPIEHIMFRARLVTVGLAIVMMLATCWIGRTIAAVSDVTASDFDADILGLLAAAICGTMLLTQQQARMASYDMHLAAWCTLSVAGALAAVRRASSSRSRIVGWITFVIALAMAWMSKGPVAMVIVGAGVVPALWLLSDRRMRHTVVFGTCLLAALLLASPWYAYLYLQKPNAFKTLLDEYEAVNTTPQPVWFYALQLLKLGLPWTLWAIGGLLLPFFGTGKQDRKGKFVPWIWFVVILIAFSVSTGKSTRYILPIAPSLALLAALLWWEHVKLARSGVRDPGVKWFIVPHWIGIMTASLGLGWFLWQQDWLIAHGWMPNRIVQVIDGRMALALTLLLAVVAAIGIAQQHRARPLAAAFITALWMCIASTIYWRADAQTPRKLDPYEAQAHQVVEVVGGSELFFLRNRYDDQPDYDFLFFLRRVVPPVRPGKLSDVAQSHPNSRVYVMAESGEQNARVLQQAQFEHVLDFADAPDHRRTLWRTREPLR